RGIPMERRLAFVVVSLLIALTCAQEAALDAYYLSVDVFESGEAHCTLSLTYRQDGDELSGGYLVLPGKASYVSVTDEEGALKFGSAEVDNLTEVRFLFRDIIPDSEEYRVTVDFWTFDLTRKDQDEWVLEVAYVDPPMVERYSLAVTLPEGAAYNPGDETWSSVQADGGRVILSTEGAIGDTLVAYSLPSDRNTALPELALGLLIFLVGAIVGYRTFLREPVAEQERDITRLLDDTERKVYQLLSTEGPSLRQSDIVERTGLPKSTVSRTLERLERKKIVTKERVGREYKIILA
ncbi:MAG: MarR family transcriptional regulator, partial [Candidatus Undinarchaeales archaeon]|nr:MarR family transcriptional regulator [Candidatus Undinarchaeales archaeon]